MNGFAFTPDILQRIPVLVARGYDVDQITGILRCERASLISICSKHGIDLKPAPEEPSPVLAAVEDCRRRRAREGSMAFGTALAGDARTLLAREAGRRGITAEELGTCLLELVARDNLFGAVLDR